MEFIVKSNSAVSANMMLMELEGDTGGFSRPGQFVNLAVDGCFLRRPFSVCRYDEGALTILYDVVGEGTEKMQRFPTGKKVDMLVGLGNGFDTDSAKGKTPILLGGGCGVAPLLGLAEALIEKRFRPVVALGFNAASQIVLEDKFIQLGISPIISTVDGSYGTKGYVTDALREAGININSTCYFYSCGPLPMLRSLCEEINCDGEVSLESRMACGFGLCMCCSVKTKQGAKRICKEGPVFKKEELIWL